jgi:hypothetical protein
MSYLSIWQMKKVLLGFTLAGTLLVLSACDSADLPSYWLCDGFAIQELVADNGIVKESYIDHHQLVLDIWGKSIYQFYQPTLSSSYQVCDGTDKVGEFDGLMHFAYPNCNLDPHPTLGLIYADGVLSPASGLLVIHERKRMNEHLIRNEGRYQCQNLGHRFSFNEINYVKP